MVVETLTWWRAACCAASGAGLARSACTGTQLWLWLGTPSRTRNQSLVPDGQPHLEEEEEGEEEGDEWQEHGSVCCNHLPQFVSEAQGEILGR